MYFSATYLENIARQSWKEPDTLDSLRISVVQIKPWLPYCFNDKEFFLNCAFKPEFLYRGSGKERLDYAVYWIMQYEMLGEINVYSTYWF